MKSGFQCGLEFLIFEFVHVKRVGADLSAAIRSSTTYSAWRR